MGLVILASNLLFGLRGLDIGSRVLIDTDGYMRYNRVLELLTGSNGWWDGWAYRANAPFGHSMHWTRPLDAFLVALAAPVAGFSGWRDGLYFAALVLGPILHVTLGLAVAWLATPLVPSPTNYLAGMAVAAQSGILSYSAPGRPDHHILIALLAVVMMGSIVRLALDQEERWTRFAAVTAAGGLWVSTEFLAPLALALAFLGWLSVTKNNHLGRFGLWLAVGLAGALVLERPPIEYLSVEYDRISVVHLVLAALVAIVGFAPRLGKGPASRFGVLALGAIAAAVVLRQLFPHFFGGPFADVPAEVVSLWLVRVAELAPLWDAAGQRWSDASLVIGTGVIGLVIGVVRLRTQSAKHVWSFLLISLAVFLALTLRSVRFAVYPPVLGAIPIASWASVAIARISGRGLGRSLRRVFAMSVVVVGMAYPFMAAYAIEGPPSAATSPGCDLSDVAAPLNRALGEREGAVVLASLDSGPELLHRFAVRIVADPYHRNTVGILDSYAMFGNGDPTPLLDKHQVEYILVCEHDPDRGVYADGGLYSRLISGSDEPGFVPIDLGPGSAYRLYLRQVD